MEGEEEVKEEDEKGIEEEEKEKEEAEGPLSGNSLKG